MAAKYSKAPISELVFGIKFNSNLLLANGIFFDLINRITSNFPVIQTHPVPQEEELINGMIQVTIDYATSGFSIYRLSSQDRKLQILITQNSLTLHWYRRDDESVGNYPGFGNIFDKFYEQYSAIKSLITISDQEFENSIKSFYLCYNDRANLEEFKRMRWGIPLIINLPSPSFSYGGRTYPEDNYYCKYSTNCEDISGYSIITINTPTAPEIGQVLVVENRLIGIPDDKQRKDLRSWFDIAHEIQLSFFENIFTDRALNHWR
jgi:uncharacterized protein (TIGR04255 family)